ncbi:helix-turn-helix domain-containing protein [Glycomyces paridis]|uniref:Uncharacterized protein n=1 Tax=Glycomyces paridis TaxID=2126555 RepID=A0A4S8P0I2_9ACTN|nr:hypothetical protein [Glycomyces paridis]THV22082.1 hypothetical protein E9998_23990 [Glycomyces paridis]
MDGVARPTRFQHTSSDAKALLAAGESGRFEFKRDANAVESKTLATLANWVALEPSREVAHLLVGVDEVTNPATGLTYGIVRGLPKGLEKSVARLQDVASTTYPIPVDLFIVEEAVEEDLPFLRVEVRPTMPPHFDGQGRRQTRMGRSTRPMADEELLQVYLDREAGTFAARFRHTSVELREAVGAVGTQVDQISDAIERRVGAPLEELAATARQAVSAAEDAEAAAMNAGSAADMVEYGVTKVERMVSDLQEVVDELHEDSLESLVLRVAQVRREVWWEFTADTWTRSSAGAERLARVVHEVLSAEISLEATRNTWEVGLWEDVLTDRKAQAKGTLRWWTATVEEARGLLQTPVYPAPELPDMRAELQADRDGALEDPNSLTRKFTNLLDS